MLVPERAVLLIPQVFSIGRNQKLKIYVDFFVNNGIYINKQKS